MKRKNIAADKSYYSLFESELGFGGVVASAEGLLEVFLPFDGKNQRDMLGHISIHYAVPGEESPVTKRAADLLSRYFAGETADFALAIDRRGFTPFQWAVYRSVMAIPYGEVRSYSRVAEEIGSPRAARGIGGAMARNPLPIIIPCHRVVGKSGELTGYSAPGGVVSKLWLLEMERRVIREKSSKNAMIPNEL